MIRFATKDDVDELVAIELKSFKHGAWDKAQFLQIMRLGKGKFWVTGKPIVGYIYVTPHGRILSLAAMGKCGFGSKLLSHAEKIFKKLHLEVCESNKRAIRFYEDRGYVQYGYRKKYYDNGEAALLFKKDLNIVHTSDSL